MRDITYKALQGQGFIQALLPRVFTEGKSHKHGHPPQLILAITQFLTHPPAHTEAKPETYKIGIPHKSHCCMGVLAVSGPGSQRHSYQAEHSKDSEFIPSNQSGADLPLEDVCRFKDLRPAESTLHSIRTVCR